VGLLEALECPDREHASRTAGLPISLPIDSRWQTPACAVAAAPRASSAVLSAWERISQHLAKVRVAGSNPVVRSTETPGQRRFRPALMRVGARSTTGFGHTLGTPAGPRRAASASISGSAWSSNRRGVRLDVLPQRLGNEVGHRDPPGLEGLRRPERQPAPHVRQRLDDLVLLATRAVRTADQQLASGGLHSGQVHGLRHPAGVSPRGPLQRSRPFGRGRGRSAGLERRRTRP
jgi:hypothetical protein